ncbi:uncharacterized protein PODANS_5_9070 [Podospora anserina S mat+]|uniref:Podospora anserina S mat+ genomic DNA chromosome 5, supercontig 9 n=1 Tax=Podospora anserina (strain S / ATCC MYA-4624 / DSM 980 / FGSC 10383) TaxID=515849 RepID=B2AKV9_PODAN|nr:uncharacterized protein PODANS_5_9070 [Podospora anserina S mat+]CAP64632.1 unnamed protein product [Podospora anserina S mat+]CDP30030.1 Putative protein of unknown function [Podospora anserina S mat+]
MEEPGAVASARLRGDKTYYYLQEEENSRSKAPPELRVAWRDLPFRVEVGVGFFSTTTTNEWIVFHCLHSSINNNSIHQRMSLLRRPQPLNLLFSGSRWVSVPPFPRFIRHQAFDASFDEEQLSEARRWHQSFKIDSLPEGNTSFARSSGPGGQHVNKTETKATTTWPVPQLLSRLPKLLHAGVRESKYFSKRSDSLVFQAQTQRSRTANSEENRQKLFDELQQLYEATVPNATRPEKAAKYEALKKSATETRIKTKKHHSSKKAYRKGVSE